MPLYSRYFAFAHTILNCFAVVKDLIILLVIFLQQMSGIGVAGVAIWTIFCKHQYISLLVTSSYAIGTYALLVAGLMAVFGGFLGCCGVWREQRAMILCVSIELKLLIY